MSLQCSDFIEALRALRNVQGFSELTLLQVLLAHSWKGLGRVGASKVLKMSERRVRKIIEYLRVRGLIDDSGGVIEESLKKLFNTLEIKTISNNKGFHITAYAPLSTHLLEMAASRIVDLRDYLVIGTGSSSSIWMIGVSLGSARGIIFPRVPADYVSKILEGDSWVELENSLVVVWRVYEGIRSDSVVIHSLAQLCASP
ncbi:hypothetical protein IMZ38_03210 [Thermosphaera chiliense]|uniref:Uncharacterized protein n=1 Tax=Thermosphaera chiliense TaxID=3402707 RepID=A0A7M1USG6_9CREN|nr:hypothetical protein [Thermosphaera aggregans]QOR94929.1 hypothetical protein IMZ38_03210 [Thermosphaera aggregans]